MSDLGSTSESALQGEASQSAMSPAEGKTQTLPGKAAQRAIYPDASAQPPEEPPPEEPTYDLVAVYRLNAPDVYTDSLGNVWNRLANYGDGSTSRNFSQSNPVQNANNPIDNTVDSRVYETEIFADNLVNGRWGFSLPVDPAKTYTLRVHYAEIFFEAAGRRVFDIYVNDTLEIADFDIYERVGSFYALALDFPDITGVQDIHLQMAKKQNTPKISGVEVYEHVPTT